MKARFAFLFVGVLNLMAAIPNLLQARYSAVAVGLAVTAVCLFGYYRRIPS